MSWFRRGLELSGRSDVPTGMQSRVAVLSSFLLLTCAHAPPATTTAPRVVTTVPPPEPAAAPQAAPPAVAHVAYPTPPAQKTPWRGAGHEAPLGIATAKLFEQGMADPRTLPYREIELSLGDVWSGGGDAVKTHGWVLPGDQYAVAWNGLVYRVRSTGAAADVRADMKELFAADDAAIRKEREENPGWTPHRFPATSEAFFTSIASVTPAKVALLLRLGEDALAQKMWSALGDSTHGDPYHLLVQDWLWSQYDRGVTAYMRGDDDLAIESLRTLPALSAQVDAECDARHVQREQRNDKKPVPCASFLSNVSDLLSEVERRAASPAPRLTRESLAAMSSLPAPQRIQKLIGALDQVSARQWGQPGGVSLGQDPIVEALIKEGEPAVEPLIAVFEEDTRLTRSVQFWRDFARYRSVLAVYEAAYVALSGILDASFFQAVSTGDHLTARGVEGRRAVGAKIREHWSKWKGVPLEERFYRTLADDKATPDQWLTAALSITQPSNVQVVPSSNVFQSSMSTPLAPGQKPSLRGESLRGKTSPTVSSLLEKRLPAMPDPRQSCAFAQAFAAWDSQAASPHVAALTRTMIGGYGSATDKSFAGSCIGTLTNARVLAGDAAALSDYGSWIVGTTPEQGDYNLESWFAPMVAHPTQPDVAAAAATLFGNGSPWVPFVSAKSSYTKERMLELPLFQVDAFKKHVIAALGDRKKVGTVKVRSGDSIEVKTDGFTSSRGVYPPDPDARAGQVIDLRVCDEYAAVLETSLARHDDKADKPPAFRLSWPMAKKDHALSDLIAFLRKH